MWSRRLENNIKGNDWHEINHEPTFEISTGDFTSVVNAFETFIIVVTGIENYQYIDEKYAVNYPVGDLPTIDVLRIYERHIDGCLNACVNEKEAHEAIPLTQNRVVRHDQTLGVNFEGLMTL